MDAAAAQSPERHARLSAPSTGTHTHVHTTNRGPLKLRLCTTPRRSRHQIQHPEQQRIWQALWTWQRWVTAAQASGNDTPPTCRCCHGAQVHSGAGRQVTRRGIDTSCGRIARLHGEPQQRTSGENRPASSSPNTAQATGRNTHSTHRSLAHVHDVVCIAQYHVCRAASALGCPRPALARLQRLQQRVCARRRRVILRSRTEARTLQPRQ